MTGGSGIYMNGVINGDTASISNKGMLSTKNSLKTCNGIKLYTGNVTNDRVGILTMMGWFQQKGVILVQE